LPSGPPTLPALPAFPTRRSSDLATIRPFQLTAEELAAAPKQTKYRDNKPANEYKFVMAVSPLDCMGCGECVTVCPTKAITMVPRSEEHTSELQSRFDLVCRLLLD